MPLRRLAQRKIGWRRRSGAIWRRLGKGFCGSGGIVRCCSTLSGCSTAIECDGTDRKRPQPDKSHKPWSEANGSAVREIRTLRCDVEGTRNVVVEIPAGAPVLDPSRGEIPPGESTLLPWYEQVRMPNPICHSFAMYRGMSQLFRRPVIYARFRDSLL